MRQALVLSTILASSLGLADPHLKPGFPVSMSFRAGTMAGGPWAPAVGDIGGQPGAEIIASAFLKGPLYAWTATGALVTGFPFAFGGDSIHFPIIANSNGLGYVVTNIQGPPSSGQTAIVSGTGAMLSGWPRTSGNYLSTPPSASDLDFDGTDEILRGSEDRRLDVFAWNGSNYPFYPKVFSGLAGQFLATPYVADLNQDSYPDVFTSGGNQAIAFSGINAAWLPGYPVSLPTFPSLAIEAIGDLDGDDLPELIAMSSSAQVAHLVIFNHMGQEVHHRILDNLLGEDLPWNRVTLADVTGDDLPEIVLACDEGIRITNRFGDNLPGWPRFLGNGSNRRASYPMVGDVDGDSQPDIVLQTNIDSGHLTEVRVYDRLGNLHPATPKIITSSGNTHCAIADIDEDGRNDIIAYALPSLGWTIQEQIWAYDISSGPCGPIHWGQALGGPKRTGFYIPVTSTTPARTLGVTVGSIKQGSVESTRLRDDSRLTVDPSYAGQRNAPVIECVFEGFTLDAKAKGIGLEIESNTGIAGKSTAIHLWDWAAGEWVHSGSYQSSATDQNVRTLNSVNGKRFVHNFSRRVRARVQIFDDGVGARWKWNVNRARLVMHRS